MKSVGEELFPSEYYDRPDMDYETYVLLVLASMERKSEWHSESYHRMAYTFVMRYGLDGYGKKTYKQIGYALSNLKTGRPLSVSRVGSIFHGLIHRVRSRGLRAKLVKDKKP